MYWLTMIKRLVLFCCLCLPALNAVSAQELKFAFDNYHRYYREARLRTDSVIGGNEIACLFSRASTEALQGEYVRAAPGVWSCLRRRGHSRYGRRKLGSERRLMPIGRVGSIQQPMTGWALM